MTRQVRDDQLASLLRAAEPILRTRIRQRRLVRSAQWDTSDAFASVVRRIFVVERTAGVRMLDLGHSSPTLSPVRTSRFWALLESILRGVLADFARKSARDRRVMRAAEVAAAYRQHDEMSSGGDALEIEAILASADETDRQILELRLRGVEWVAVQAATGLSAAACRQRWSRLIRRMQPPQQG